MKIIVNHKTGEVSQAHLNCKPKISAGINPSVLNIVGAPSVASAIRGVELSAILYHTLKSPTIEFSRLGEGKIVRD